MRLAASLLRSRLPSRLPPRRPFRLRSYSTPALSRILSISAEVQSALSSRTPVVALESAIYTHGFPYPDNVDLARSMERTVREHGAVPATICVLDGVARVGLSAEQLLQMAEGTGKPKTTKVSRRDLPFVTGVTMANPDERYVGGTTIAGTMVLAHLAGIKVFATGGLGGVHRGAEHTMDVSADLTELGRTNVAVISSGAKAFLDLEKTLEYLETQGVYVGTFGQRNRDPPIELPAFYSVGSGIPSPSVVESPEEAATIIYASHTMGLTSGQFFANPIPEADEIPHAEIREIIAASLRDAPTSVKGKDITPYILNDIKARTEGRSIPANRALVLNNAAMGAKVAVELAKLENQSNPTPDRSMPTFPSLSEKSSANTTTISELLLAGDSPKDSDSLYPLMVSFTSDASNPLPAPPNLLAIGGVAVDTSFIHTPPNSLPSSATSKVALYTSNPSKLVKTLGGVATNVSRAASLLGVRPRLVSAVGPDPFGLWTLAQLRKKEFDTAGIYVSPGKLTAQYMALYDTAGSLVVGAADFSCVAEMPAEHVVEQIKNAGKECGWVIVDGNLGADTLREVLRASKEAGMKVAFEPTSVAKARNVFVQEPGVFPDEWMYAAAPNVDELGAMFDAAGDNGWLVVDNKKWFGVLDSLEARGNRFQHGLRQLSTAASTDLSGSGIIQKSLQLLPYIPNLFIKLGAHGVVALRILPPNDRLLSSSRTSLPTSFSIVLPAESSTDVGGLWIGHFPVEKVEQEKVVSVNGAGDTFMGALVAGWVQGLSMEGAVVRAQKAARETVMSTEAVGEGVKRLRNE